MYKTEKFTNNVLIMKGSITKPKLIPVARKSKTPSPWYQL